MLQNAKIICCTGIVALYGSLASADIVGQANWDLAEATHAVAVTDTAPTRERLRILAAAGSQSELLKVLQSIPARTDWSAPARESALYQFVQDLRGMPPRAVAPEVMAFLKTFEPQVLIAHDDHPQASIPLFNIRAAAAGLENEWKRREAAFEGARMLALDPVLLVNAFLEQGDPAVRRGLLDSLAQADPGQLEAVCFLALAAVEREPAITDLAGQAALRNADARALEQLVRTGSGPSITHILRQSTEILSERQLVRLMDTAVNEAPAQTASIAIAELAPSLAVYPNHAEALMDLLGNPELGSTAALALARNASASTLRRLQNLAEMDDGSLVAHRARMALNINRSAIGREVRE